MTLADDPKIVKNLKEKVLGTQSFYTVDQLITNSTYNDLIFGYWNKVDNFPESFRTPNQLTSVEPIARAIRLLPNREKNIKAEQRIRKFYSKETQDMILN